MIEPPPRSMMLGRYRLDAEEAADQVDAQHPLEVLPGGVHDAAHQQDAGVVHEDIHAAKMAHGGSDDPGPVLFAGDVVMLEEGRLAQGTRERLAFGILHVGEHHAGPFLDEQARGRGAHAACATGDDGGLIREPIHSVPVLSATVPVVPKLPCGPPGRDCRSDPSRGKYASGLNRNRQYVN